jgi:mono/diheme cytochrome c family protein
MGAPAMKRLCWLVTVLPLLISFSQVHAQEIGDTQNGLAWAQQVCSECHAIRRN